MKSINSYFDGLFERNLRSFEQLSTFELVNIFNKETSHNGWVGARGAYLEALKTSFKNRNIDISEIATENTLSLMYPIFFREKGNKIIPIKREWLKE